MGKRRRWQFKALSFLLALIMVLQDGAAVAVRAEEKNVQRILRKRAPVVKIRMTKRRIQRRSNTGKEEGKDPGTNRHFRVRLGFFCSFGL